MNRGADPAALDRRLARPMMTGDEEDDALIPRDRLLQATVDGLPRGVEGQAVKVEDPLGLDGA